MVKVWRIWIILMALTLALLPGPAAAHQGDAAQSDSPVVVTLRLNGALHPAMMEHIKRAEMIAEREGAAAIILELNTPGGEVQLMTSMMERIRGSSIPVVVYVSPRGAMAGSAGALITIAGHISAMAPETTIGAASPVQSSGTDIGGTMESKLKNIMKATVRSYTTHRPPEAVRLAEEMIDDARAVSVDEAVEIGLVDVKANNINDLLNKVDGLATEVDGEPVTLVTAGARVVDVPRSFTEEALMVLANPNIVFLLLAIGVQAILIELSTPGGWVAGFIGVVCLLLATYGMGVLPVNWFGLLFMVMSFVLFILELKTPTHGALTVAGVASFIVGALVLFNSPNVPTFQRVSVPLVIASGVVIGLLFFVVLGFALRAQMTPLRLRTSMVGQVGVVNTPLTPIGTVQLGSELWTAVLEDGHQPAPKGTRVEVIGQEHLRIRVRKVGE